MWVEDQSGALINLDYVTSIEPTVMEAAYGQQKPKWAVVAHRMSPSADAVLLSHLDEQRAFRTVRRIREFLEGAREFVDVRALSEEPAVVDVRDAERTAPTGPA
jgi:hypothetical protein